MSYATFEAAGWRDWNRVLTDGRDHTIRGTVKILTIEDAPYLCGSRRLWLRLPSSYFHTERSYPLLVMLDGQNLFDRATSYSGTEWGVDETLLHMESEGIEAIVLGIENAGEGRAREYLPWAAESAARDLLSYIVGFLLPSLHPYCRLLPGRAHTSIAGSSLGANFALWAYHTCRDVFGGCAAFSPATRSGRLVETLATYGPTIGRVYLDHGDITGGDQGCSAWPVYTLLRGQGARNGGDLLYAPIEHPSQVHHESAWASRFPTAARFLLAPAMAGR